MKDIFVREDIAKPENRVNLALFHLQMDEGFHKWFCEELQLPVSAIIYPTENLSGDRPDLIVKDADRTIGYIEVELGDENKSQLSTYRYKYESDQTKIFSITGKSFHKSDLSLEEISVFLSSKLDTLSNKQKVLSAQYLIKLIETYSNNIISYSRIPVSDEVLNQPFVNKLLYALEDFKPDQNLIRAEPGKYYIDTNSPKGFSFRVFSKESTLPTKSTALFSITKGRDYIVFLSEKWYRKYLGHKPDIDVSNWVAFIVKDLKLPINSIELKQKLELSNSSVDRQIDTMIDLIKKLI